LGETHHCFTVLCAHDILTAAVFDAWVRYEACRALLAMADDTAHRQHDAVVEWMADPHSKVDPWAVLDAEGHSACAAPEDLPPTGYEALSVDGDKGFGLRDAMRRCKAIESAKQLAAALPSAAPTPLRSRL
jgi:hypothetical protein